MDVITDDDPTQGLYKERFSSLAYSKQNPPEPTVATTLSPLLPTSLVSRI